MLPVECAELALTVALLGTVLLYEFLRALNRPPRTLTALVVFISLACMTLSLCGWYATWLLLACSIPQLGVAGHSILRLAWVLSWYVTSAGPAGLLRAFLVVKHLIIDLVMGVSLAIGGALNAARWISGVLPPY